MSNEFGHEIARLRSAAGLTQAELASQAGVTNTYISKIERGKLQTPPGEMLIRKMARLLKADATDLLESAGTFDPRAIRRLIRQEPWVGVLIRRLQDRELTQGQALRIIGILYETQDAARAEFEARRGEPDV